MAQVKAPALSPALLMQAEFVRNIMTATVPPGVPFESVLAPDFWAHCASKVRPYTKIELRAQDNAWYGELMVRKVEPQAVHVWALCYVDLASQAAPKVAATAEDFSVTFGGPKHLWRIVRNADKTVIHYGEANEADAKAWLDAYLSKAAA